MHLSEKCDVYTMAGFAALQNISACPCMRDLGSAHITEAPCAQSLCRQRIINSGSPPSEDFLLPLHSSKPCTFKKQPIMTAKSRSDGKYNARFLQSSSSLPKLKTMKEKHERVNRLKGYKWRPSTQPGFQQAVYTLTVPSVPRIQNGRSGNASNAMETIIMHGMRD